MKIGSYDSTLEEREFEIEWLKEMTGGWKKEVRSEWRVTHACRWEREKRCSVYMGIKPHLPPTKGLFRQTRFHHSSSNMVEPLLWSDYRGDWSVVMTLDMSGF